MNSLFNLKYNENNSLLNKNVVGCQIQVWMSLQNSPRWLKRGVGTLLTRQLHRPQGLQAVVEAVRDAANCASPSSSAHMEAVARVVAASPDLINMCRQVLLQAT